MNLLKIKAFQPFACYRKPFSYGFWDTFPLPPFSTILGWVHWVLGESDRQEKLPINIGVAGQFETITYDLQTLIKFDRKRGKEGEIVLEDFNKALSNTPTYVANVTNIHHRIYLKMEDEYMERFADQAMQINFPSLGRYEDLMRIDSIDFITPEFIEIGGLDEPISVDYGIYLRPETTKSTGIKGSNFKLPFYHKEINGLRFFEKEKVVYTDSGSLKRGNFLVDRDTDKVFPNPVVIELFGKYKENN